MGFILVGVIAMLAIGADWFFNLRQDSAPQRRPAIGRRSAGGANQFGIGGLPPSSAR
jgi:hypothetical protein